MTGQVTRQVLIRVDPKILARFDEWCKQKGKSRVGALVDFMSSQTVERPKLVETRFK